MKPDLYFKLNLCTHIIGAICLSEEILYKHVRLVASKSLHHLYNTNNITWLYEDSNLLGSFYRDLNCYSLGTPTIPHLWQLPPPPGLFNTRKLYGCLASFDMSTVLSCTLYKLIIDVMMSTDNHTSLLKCETYV